MKLITIYETLMNHYGDLGWWPADTPFEVMVGAILTQNTAWTNVEKAIARFDGELTPARIQAFLMKNSKRSFAPRDFTAKRQSILRISLRGSRATHGTRRKRRTFPRRNCEENSSPCAASGTKLRTAFSSMPFIARFSSSTRTRNATLREFPLTREKNTWRSNATASTISPKTQCSTITSTRSSSRTPRPIAAKSRAVPLARSRKCVRKKNGHKNAGNCCVAGDRSRELHHRANLDASCCRRSA